MVDDPDWSKVICAVGARTAELGNVVVSTAIKYGKPPRYLELSP